MDKKDDLLQSLDRIEEYLNILSSPPEHVILTNKEAQNLLKVSNKTLQKWRDNGLIKYSRIGREIYYTLKSILEMLERHAIQEKSF